MKQISFLINTSVNTLEHVKLLMKSLKDNLYGDKHEILVFVDSDNEGTVDYLRSIKKDYYDLKIITHRVKPCIGYSRNNNLLVELAKHDIVSYLQSDMVISKHYDVNVLQNLENNCILSATRIEPPLHGFSESTITQGFGFSPDEFEYESFLKFAEKAKKKKNIKYFFAPFTFHKKTWLDYGGYDTLFRRSREDSDLLQRFIHGGVKIKQTYSANVYHFSCVTSRGKDWFLKSNKDAQDRLQIQNKADSIELRRFLRKWGNFNHGNLLQKYDCDLVIPEGINFDQNILINIEPFFSRVWLSSQHLLDSVISNIGNEHEFANNLLNFTDQDWNIASKYYNQTDYSEIYKVGIPENWNAKLNLKLEKLDRLYQYLTMLSSVISSNEPGTYEFFDYPESYIDIRAAVKVDVPLKVENPPFDKALLSIE